MTAAEIRSELMQRVQEGEIEEESIPKESWKYAMALQAIEAAERSLDVGGF
ncbi:12909_t:CDS:2 [Funneliformis geosporum]|uniref:2450_t:CDS:1 n=1 Tax=Funneliformis geosporum TaxID=1117311 RepID=A0A9W4T0N7_9GLOM|nr:2450_t:CDS:2 [Funneliformis geosporum]CAI2194886.1 12909_t:CDS:2 [Funneliformis geosporum]